MTENKSSEKKRRKTPPPTDFYQGILDRMKDLGLLDYPGFAIDVLKTFVRDATKTMDRLEKAAEEGNRPACEELAHRVRGASLNLGAIELGQIATKIEDLCAEGELSLVRSLVKELRKEFDSVRSFIAQMSGSSKAA